MSHPHPDYDEIARLEKELGFEPSEPAKPLPPPNPPPPPPKPPRRQISPEEHAISVGVSQFKSDVERSLFYPTLSAASAASSYHDLHTPPLGMKLRRVTIYGPNGKLL